ncbi:F-box domain-containing protein/FBA_1 domain-containing protein [Cephalotus follicularis]|uniref:F-box domain-containing protein/FBA_1 domain-containing protein n=1 Tax=Cephalotus follicularis TaxID=3775 RepID=A0A1Q3B4B0_CEPFO|nr:F-box domain-containing protein/FBA_1 domain-containing protein [Cephalotus follicularis]
MMVSLPVEIITDILSRLPVKSLCRFRCVSKLSLSIISSSHFAKTHLSQTQSHRLLLSSHSLFSVHHDPSFHDHVVSVDLDFPLKNQHNSDHSIQVLGSCNGLLCIMPQLETFFIYNPSTKESKWVPDFECSIHPSLIDYDVYGFGYAQSVDDYKFVVISCGQVVIVYSLRSNSWKKVLDDDFPYEYPCCEPGTSLNGAVHWLLKRRGGGPCFIAAFNLVEDKFKDLPLPYEVVNFHHFSMGLLKGCLCVVHNDGRAHKEFWVMKEYGLKESWTKVLIADPYYVLRPLCYWKNSKIMLAVDRKQLVLCNPKDGSCKDFVVDGISDKFDAHLYVESLISPNLLH